MPDAAGRLPAFVFNADVSCAGFAASAEVNVEVSYLVEGSSRAGGASSRLSHMHSRAASTSSAASWDSSMPPQSHSSSRAGGLDSYMEASVSRMLAGGRDRYVNSLGRTRSARHGFRC